MKIIEKYNNMQNWYSKFIKISQVQPSQSVAISEEARNKKINAVQESLKNDFFPQFADAIGNITYNSGTSRIESQLNSWIDKMPEILQIDPSEINRVVMRNILTDLASYASKMVTAHNQPNVWTFINMDQTYITRLITAFTTAYTPSDQSIQVFQTKK